MERGLHLTLEDQDGHSDDITSYLSNKLKAGRGRQEDQIRAEIHEKSSGIFLWVVLVVQILNKEFDRGRIHALRKRLQEIPAGLGDLFKDMLTRDSENATELLLCIQWILFAKRPLRREELYFAIMSEVDPQSLGAWDPGELTLDAIERFILSSSKGLAEITKTKPYSVQFIHESVRDYLLKKDGLRQLRFDGLGDFLGSSHERLKVCCHNYIQVDIYKILPLEVLLPPASSENATKLRRSMAEQFPFLEYAVHSVLYHSDAAEAEGIPQISFIEMFRSPDWIRPNNALQGHQTRRYT